MKTTTGKENAGALRLSRVAKVMLASLCLLGASVMGGGSVWARPKRVTVTGFPGAGGGKARYYVIKRLRKRHDVVPVKKYVRAAKRLGVRISGRRNIRRICRKAGIDAVIFGRVLRSRGRWWLRLYVKDGRTGRTAKRSIIRLRGPRLNSSSRYSIRAALRKGMSRVKGVPREEPDPEPRVVEERVAPEIEIEKKEEKTAEDEPMGPRPGYMSVVEGGVVLDVVGRRFVVSPTDQNPDYRTEGVIPPMGLWLEIYPGALMTKHLAGANLGLGFWWTRSFGVTSHTEGGSEDYTSVYQKLDFFLTYRWNILQSPKSPEVKLDLGIGNLQFKLDAPSDEIKALGVSYWYFKPRIRFRVPIALPRISVLASFGYLHPFQTGPTSEWWAYGHADAWGVEAMGGVDVRVYWKLHARLVGHYTHFGLSYPQDGTLNYDYSLTANKGTDRYYGVTLGVSVKYF
jgi:hypothetical protein